MADKNGDDLLKDDLDRLEEVNIGEITDEDLDSVAGGMLDPGDCNSVWCCSNPGG